MNKFYILEEMTQEDLNNLALERNTLKKENEKLNHYKLLYQKVKERNDEAIKFVESYMREDYYEEIDEYITHLTWNMTKEDLLDILKGNNESK